MGPVGIFRNRLVIWSYLVLLRSVMYVDVYMNYDSVKIACRETSRFQIYRSEKATNGQNWDILWYILKCKDQTYMVFWIENGGNSGLDMLKTICVQSFSFQSYSLAKGPEKQQKTTKWGEKSVFFLHFLFIFAFCPKQHMYFDSLNSFNFILRPWEPFWAKLAIFEKFLPDPLSQSKMST